MTLHIEQVYCGVPTEGDAHLITDLGKEKMLPIVIDANKPETLSAAAAKVKSELGKASGL